jgi:preprotein translocase subunit Sss1
MAEIVLVIGAPLGLARPKSKSSRVTEPAKPPAGKENTASADIVRVRSLFFIGIIGYLWGCG